MYTYLILSILVVSSAFVVQWLNLVPNWKVSKAILSSAIISIPFIIWDVIFTEKGVWGFNYEYLMDVDIINLPLEEVLFFITIPTASLLIYELTRYIDLKIISISAIKLINLTFLAITIVISIVSLTQNLIYTATVSLTSLAILLYSHNKDIGTLKYFYPAYIITLIPFFFVNGILTAGITIISPKPIVWYNEVHNLGVRFITIPLEDFLYMYLLLLPNTLIYDKLKKRQ